MAQISECLGTNIRRYRRQQGMTQKELADLIEVSKETIGNIETGRRWVTTETVKKIANVLTVDQIQLFEDLNGVSRVSVVHQVCKILSTVPLDILESLCEINNWDEVRTALHKITNDHSIKGNE